MSSPHPNRAAAGPVRLVDPGYVATSPAEESAALAALGRLLAWAAAPNQPRNLPPSPPAARRLDDACWRQRCLHMIRRGWLCTARQSGDVGGVWMGVAGTVSPG